MRAIFYAPGWPPERFPNGIVTALGALAPALRAKGCDVRIVAEKGDAGAMQDDAICFTENPKPRPFRDAVRRRLLPRHELFVGPAERIAAALLARPDFARADIFEIEESFGWAAHLQRRLPMPVVTALHGPWFLNGAADSAEGMAVSLLDQERIRREGDAIARAEAVSARSRAVLGAVREFYELDLPQAVVIPNAAVLPDEPWRLEAADENEILFVGRFDRVKGADILLEAFAMLAVERPALRLVFAGPNERTIRLNGQNRRKEDLLASIMPPEATARVAFLGPVPHGELGALRRRAFATVIASRIETFPNVVLEALAHGSPTVATGVGGIPEIARDGTDALLVPPEPGAIAAALGALLDDPQRAASLGATGRARIADEFSPARIARMTLDYYSSVIARRSGANKTKAG